MAEHEGEKPAVVVYQQPHEGDVLPEETYEQEQEQKAAEFVQRHMRRHMDNLERQALGLPPLREDD